MGVQRGKEMKMLGQDQFEEQNPDITIPDDETKEEAKPPKGDVPQMPKPPRIVIETYIPNLIYATSTEEYGSHVVVQGDDSETVTAILKELRKEFENWFPQDGTGGNDGS